MFTLKTFTTGNDATVRHKFSNCIRSLYFSLGEEVFITLELFLSTYFVFHASTSLTL